MSRFAPNPAFESQLKRTVGYLEALEHGAEPGAEAARSFAPVRTGAYRDSIQVTREGAQVRIEATDFKSNWIEFGTSKMAPRAPLRRGVRSAGLKFKGSST